MTRQSLPALTLHRPSGQARVRIGGRDIYLGAYGSPESYEKYAELLRQLGNLGPAQNSGDLPLVGSLSIGEVAARFAAHASSYFTAGESGDSKDLKHFQVALRLLIGRYGRLPISQLSGPHLKEIQRDMVGQGWSRRYCNRQMMKVRRFLKWAVSEDLCPVEVLEKARSVDGLRRGKTSAPEKPPIRPVTDEIIHATLPFLTPTVADLVRVIRLTGARPKEIRLLRVGDLIEIEDGLLETDLSNHKNAWRGHLREITFGPAATTILRKYLNGKPDEYLFSPRRAREEQLLEMRRKRKTKVQPSQQCRKKPNPKRSPGEFYIAGALLRSIRYACEKAFKMPDELRKIPHSTPPEERKRLRALANEWRQQHCWNAYQLRHTALTQLRQVFGLEAAQAVAGHARIDMTEHYAEVGRERRRQAMKELG